jgi:hypothetical protein
VTDETYPRAVASLFRTHVRLPALGAGFLALVLAGAVLSQPVDPDRAHLTAAGSPQSAFRQLTSDADWRAGAVEGVRVGSGSLTIGRPAGRIGYAGRTWSWTRWTSAWVSPGQSFTELVPSWNAVTPARTQVWVQARVRSSAGAVSGWKTMAHWSSRDASFRRTSSTTQADRVASVATDTLVAAGGTSLTGYQLRVLPMRWARSTASPTVRSLQAVVTQPGSGTLATSTPLYGARALAVPRYSQMTHRGQYPQYGGGGQAWCSPTSLSMILGYYGALPTASTYSWVKASYSDRWVDHVARSVYDYGYRGAGNWSFNAAYAANRTSDAFVTRLRDLRDAERFIAAGIPLAASITFSSGQLTGAPIGGTAGHLVVISGFTARGDVIVNDPAAPSNSSVVRTYDRGQFERAWLRRSDGLVYVVRDAAHPLPARVAGAAW